MLKNITTKYGLTSLHQNHPKSSEKYEYRGNIHSYFNYKILYEYKTKLNKNEKKNQMKYVKIIDSILTNLKKFIIDSWNQSGKSYTMWSI